MKTAPIEPVRPAQTRAVNAATRRGARHPLLLALLLGVVSALGLVQAACVAPWGPHPDTLLVSRTIAYPNPQVHPAPFQQTVNVPDAVQHIYDELYSLPKAASGGATNCGLDPGLRYTLKSVESGKTILTATANPIGCAFVQLSPTDVRAPTLQFWGDLANTLGRPLYDVYVQPMPPQPTMTACDTPTAAP